MKKDIKIAAVCMHSETGEVHKNLDRTKFFVSQASEMGADFVCFPELSITGYILRDPEKIYPHSTSQEIIGSLDKIARSKGLIVIAGMVEISEEGRPYISQVAAGPDGLLGLYRKTHLSPQERQCFEPGQSLHTFSYGDVIFGIQLCYEAHFPEISTVMALRGTHIIFMPHASPRGTPGEKIKSWLRHLRGRAFDNAIFVVACNQVGVTKEGPSFPGGAVVLNPAGRIIARFEENHENILLAELKMDALQEMREHRMKYFIPNRRPELYGEISSKSQ
ncbi:MAG: nitrilase-related carbon-nitrogen hydrolase [Pseudomonadota bacterium]